MSDKWKCGERRCGWRGLWGEVLTAPNPFDAEDTLHGCPKCRGVENIIEVCDTTDCWEETTCGTPTSHGYRRTCGKHRPTDDGAKPNAR